MHHNSKTQSNNLTLSDRLLGLADRALRPRNQPDLPPDVDVRNIVVIKPCCLGDMLMATPVIRSLSQRFPEADLTVATSEWSQPAIQTNPRIDHLIIYPQSNPLTTAVQVAWYMRPFKFDLGVSLDRSPVVPLALRLAGVPIRVGIASGSRGLGLTHRVVPERDQHETDLYLATLHALGIDESARNPEYHVPDDALVRVREFIPGGGDRNIVVLHPGGAVNPGVAMLEKRWPATNFGELAQLLFREANAIVVVVGTESDRGAAETLKEFAHVPVIDLCGRLSLPELAALISKASLFIGNDSGTTHLASAVGTPVVAIFGPTNPNRYRPLGRRTRICAPKESWSLEDPGDLRVTDRALLPDIANVPLPAVLNACLELLKGQQ
jgi:heptosyltransferase II